MVSAVASRARAAPVEDFSRNRASHSAVRGSIGSGFGSMSASTPSRAKTNPARARRERWAKAAITGAQSPSPPSQPPARMHRHDAAGHALEAGPGEAGITQHLRERLGMWKAADRFDEIAI